MRFMRLHTLDAVIARPLAFLQLGGANHLMVGGFQIEHVFAIGSILTLVPSVEWCIGAYRTDTICCTGLRCIRLTHQDDFTISGFETKPKLGAFVHVKLKFSSRLFLCLLYLDLDNKEILAEPR